jgi:hypothetical protein
VSEQPARLIDSVHGPETFMRSLYRCRPCGGGRMDTDDVESAPRKPSRDELKLRESLLNGVCSVVRKGVAKFRQAKKVSPSAVLEASFCCCISCAVSANKRCSCVKCSNFRVSNKGDRLVMLKAIVEAAEEVADIELSSWDKVNKHRDVFFRLIVDRVVNSYTASGRVRALYKLGAAGSKITVCQSRFAAAYSSSTRTINRILQEVSRSRVLESPI